MKPLKASLDAMDIMRLAGGIMSGFLSKTMQSTKNGSMSVQQNFMNLLRTIKLHNAMGRE